MKLVHKIKQEEEIDWTSFKYMIFDSPNQKGTYEERYSLLGTFYFHTRGIVISYEVLDFI